jgi:[ribosomal protein S5]-alanine N-acetyltransferase
MAFGCQVWDWIRMGTNREFGFGSEMYRKIGEYIIRDWQVEDAPSIAKYANNRKIWMNLRDSFPNPYSLQDAENFLSRVIEANPRTIFAIATESEAIGSIGLMSGKDVHRFTAEMGYWLAEPFWGKGIMTQAVKSLTAYAIRDLKLYRIFAEPYTSNPASARVLEKAGFICEGILRSNVFKDGKVLDQFLYSYVGKTSTQPAI